MADRNPSYALLQPPRPTTATSNAAQHSPPPSTSASSSFLRPTPPPPFTPPPPDDYPSTLPLPNLHAVFSKHAPLRGTVRIRCEATVFYCHREVLMLASPYFAAVLGGGWKETAPRRKATAAPLEDTGTTTCNTTTQPSVSATNDVESEVEAAGELKRVSVTEDDSEPLQHDSTSESVDEAASFMSSVATHDSDEDEDDEDEETVVCRLRIMEEKASHLQELLMFIYPRLECSITWQNVGDLARMASKFDLPSLRQAAIAFLLSSCAGLPILSLKIAEDNVIPELYKEASRYVMDTAWPPEELQILSASTLLKLERRRSWFLERLLKLGLVQTSKDYVCQATCTDPTLCARLLDEKWRSAWSSAFRFGTPQPSIVYRSLRNLEPSLSSPALHLPHTACQSHARLYVADLFDRMFQQSIIPARSWAVNQNIAGAGAFGRIGGDTVTKSSARYFLYIEMDGVVGKQPKSHAQNAQHQQVQPAAASSS